MTAACDGLRVIDFSTWMAGPLATMVLADNGADVIKVEAPAGDPARVLPAFQTWNRGKRGVALDLNTPDGRQRAGELVRGADVVVTSMRPGTVERLGIGYAQVRALNPGIVYASISGYGEEGTRRDLPGYDALVTAKSGRMMMFEGVADRPGPAYPAIPCASYSAAMLTVQGVLAALHRRRATGRGDHVSVSLLAALMPFDLIMWIGWQLRGDLESEGVSAPMLLQKLLGERKLIEKEAPATGAYDPRELHRPKVRVPRPNYLTAVTKDGVWIQFANTMDHLCVAQMTALGLLDLYGEERFAKLPAVFTEDDAEALWGVVLERVRTKTYDEWRDIFAEHEDLAVERVRAPLESLRHRQVVHNGQSVVVPGLDGKPTLQPGPIALLSLSEPTIGRRAPQLGEHGQDVLREHRQLRTVQASGIETSGRPPLDGITILDFSAWIAAPLATTMLANLGARVIKIEQVGGDMSRYSTGGLLSFPMTQGKQSIALDLKRPEGLEIARKLIAGADMLVHNYRAGVAKRIGIDYETCRALNPRLIYLDAASYGADGPDCRKPAFFAVAAALGGTQARQVGAGHPRPGVERAPLDDLKTEAWRLLKAAEGNADPIAALGAAAALLLALHARDERGEGQSLVSTMIGSTLYASSDETIDYDRRPPAPRVDESLYGLAPAYRLYETADGWVFLCCVQESEWRAFCQAVARPDLGSRWADAWRKSPDADEIASGLAEIFRARAATDWERLLTEHGVPIAAVETRDPGRFNMQDSDMRAFGHAVQARSPVHGEYWRHGALCRFAADGAQTFGPWEPLGGHTRDILRELRYGPAAIDALVDERVVEAWTPEAALT